MPKMDANNGNVVDGFSAPFGLFIGELLEGSVYRRREGARKS
jgi:hypothetical protein